MSPDELDAIRERDAEAMPSIVFGGGESWSRTDLDRRALLELVDELLKREQRVVGLLDAWKTDEQECRRDDLYEGADTLNDCASDLRKALWPS